MNKEYIITVFSENKVGLLSQITTVFTCRDINIESLTTSESSIPGIHKFTIVVITDPEKIEKLVKQIEKKIDVLKYRSAASKGVVEHVSFRGDKMELRVRVNDTVLLAKRDLEENRIFVGETEDVFLYRIFVTVGDKAYLLENQSLQENSVVI